MSNLPVEGRCPHHQRLQGIGAVYTDRLAKHGYDVISGGSQRGGTQGALPRASSVARVLGSKSFEPI